MTCAEFREWSDRLLGTQPSLDGLAAAREHTRACGRCTRDLEWRAQVDAWDSARLEFWRGPGKRRRKVRTPRPPAWLLVR
jgi:hypothetical protein